VVEPIEQRDGRRIDALVVDGTPSGRRRSGA